MTSRKNLTRVAVGSQNPVKIQAVRLAFEALWPERKFETLGTDVKSGVSAQPMSDTESIARATNRAKAALKVADADFAVGLEGGLQQIDGHWFDCGWVVVVDKKKRQGIGSTLRLETPPRMVKMIKEGMELGDVNDKIFKKHNSKQAEGHFGLMTNNVITRTMGYRDGVIAALARYIQSSVFEGKD